MSGSEPAAPRLRVGNDPDALSTVTPPPDPVATSDSAPTAAAGEEPQRWARHQRQDQRHGDALHASPVAAEMRSVSPP